MPRYISSYATRPSDLRVLTLTWPAERSALCRTAAATSAAPRRGRQSPAAGSLQRWRWARRPGRSSRAGLRYQARPCRAPTSVTYQEHQLLTWDGRELQREIERAAEGETAPEGLELRPPRQQQPLPAARDDGRLDVGTRHDGSFRHGAVSGAVHARLKHVECEAAKLLVAAPLLQ
eukprot:scaffold52417_cov61-Phaeocystis_antarctica.AAC.4